MKEVSTFTEAVDAYLATAPHLGDADLPLVMALKKAAAALDADGVNAALVNQLRLVYNQLRSGAEDNNAGVDPHEAFLDAL